MSELTAPQPSPSAPEADDDSLDARIWRAEQRLIAREQRFRERLQNVTQRVQRAVQPKRLLVPAAGVSAGLLTLVWLWRGRRAPARAVAAGPSGSSHDAMAQHAGAAQAGGVPWVRLLGLAWPMLPAKLRDRVSPATASTVLGVGLPMAEKFLAKRSAPPLTTMPAVDLVRLAGNWTQVARLPQPLDGARGGPTRLRYQPRLDGRIDVLERRVDAQCRVRVVQGVLQPLAGSHGVRLQYSNWPDVLQALPMAWSDQWVLHVDDEYTELLLGSPSRDQLWLLSRRPQMPPQRLRALVQIAQDRGFAVERLKFSHER